MADHSSSCTSCRGSQEKISYLLGHIPATLSSYSSACAVGSLSCKVEQMLSSSCYPISGGGDGRKKSLDHDFYPFDCANGEEGAGVSEEPAKPPVPSRSSGSKRSRAAEVHNMSEKRRRSRINEKMRALQNLIPNSNKTDKASMLDEAIEYLKQLQLQVQILSVRNGLNLQSMYLSGSLQPLQSCFHLDSDTAMNIGAGMLPLNQDSAVQSSFNLSNQYTSSHQYTIKSSFINVTNPETLIVKPSESHHGSFQVPIACEEICTGDMSTNMPLDAVPYTRNITENARSATAVDASKQLGRHTSSLICINHLEECMLGNVGSSQEMLDNEENYIQQLPGLEELF